MDTAIRDNVADPAPMTYFATSSPEEMASDEVLVWSAPGEMPFLPGRAQEAQEISNWLLVRHRRRQFRSLFNALLDVALTAQDIVIEPDVDNMEWLALSERSFEFWDNELDAVYDAL
jgi:hypothetical protein